MTPQEFIEIRVKWQRIFAEKPLAEIKAMKNTLTNLMNLSNFQRELLILDMEVMVTHKERMDFDKMMKGVDIHHDF